MPFRSGGPAPYAPPAAVIAVIEAYRNRGLATPFTHDVLLRLGITASLVPRVFKSLVELGLIGKDGEPTQVFEAIRRATTDEYPKRLEELVRDQYAEVFNFADPANDPPERVADAFRAFEPVGQRKRMVTLFLALCEKAGIIPQRTQKSTSANGAQRARPKLPHPNRARPVMGKTTLPEAPRGSRVHLLQGTTRALPSGASEVPPAIAGLIASLPTGRGWTQAKRDQFMRTFEAVLDFSIPIITAAEAQEDEFESTEALE